MNSSTHGAAARAKAVPAPDEGGRIVELKALLRERFPEAHRGQGLGGTEAVEPPRRRLGVPCLDAAGVTPGMVVELTRAAAAAATAERPARSAVFGGGGGGVAIAGLLESAAEQGSFAALVDGADGFDPAGISAGARARLLWVRCREVTQAIKATDLLLRDGNLPLVVLDLQLNAEREVRRLAGSVWFRLAGLAERTGCVLVALTPCATAASAHLRITLEAAWGTAAGRAADALDRPTAELIHGLSGRVTRCRRPASDARSLVSMSGSAEAATLTA